MGLGLGLGLGLRREDLSTEQREALVEGLRADGAAAARQQIVRQEAAHLGAGSVEVRSEEQVAGGR